MENPFEIILNILQDIQNEIHELKKIRYNETETDLTEYLTVHKVADYLDCSRGYVYILKKRLPHVSVGGRLYFQRKDLLDYLDSHKKGVLVHSAKKELGNATMKRYRMTRPSQTKDDK